MGRAYEVRKASMAKTAAAKTKVYSRYGKEIYMAAKAGVADPEMNPGLKRIIEEARSKEVPADVIKRAIDKAKGGDEESYHLVTYEGFGPGGSTFIVECLTDNDNRSVSEVRNCFTKSNGKMGVSGSVSFGYDYVAILSFKFNDEEKVMDALFSAEVDLKDLEMEDGNVILTLETSDLHQAKEAVETELGITSFEMMEITYMPHEMVHIEEDDRKDLDKLLRMLDDVDDVKDVYHNIDNV